MDQNPYESPRSVPTWIEPDLEPTPVRPIDRELYWSIAIILATGVFVSFAVVFARIGPFWSRW
jgi:hypothetical protein